jgi:sialic acid synthase SpsE
MLYDIKQQADNSNIDFYITPRYLDCIEYAKSIGVDKFHVQNGDILHKQLLKELSGEHILLSTGFATFPEIDEAANILLGDDEPNNSESGVILLHSTGKMPTPPSEAQFGRMLDIGSEFFPLRYGFESFFDYRGGKILDYMAMAFNPAVVMRRIDLADRKGLETAYSLNPAEMTELVDVAQSMVAVNNPLFYHEGFVEGDFDARIQHMRCPEGDYLLPSER